MNNRIKIMGCKVDLITDEHNDSVQVATITNNSERIIRLIVKGGHSLTIDTTYLLPQQYQWSFESVHIGLEELVEMGKIAQYLLNKQEDD